MKFLSITKLFLTARQFLFLLWHSKTRHSKSLAIRLPFKNRAKQ